MCPPATVMFMTNSIVLCWKLDSVPLPLDVIKPKVVKEALQWSGERKCNVTWIKPNWQADWTYNAITSLLSNDTFVRRTSDLEKTANMSWLPFLLSLTTSGTRSCIKVKSGPVTYPENFHEAVSLSGIWLSFVFGVRCLWRHNLCHIHVSNPTFSRNVDTICMFFYMHSPLLNLCATALNINYQHSRLRYRRKIHSTVRHSSS